ncbi:MAG: dihydropteroate synthase [Candidatus Margulisiibacteriota bacterium]
MVRVVEIDSLESAKKEIGAVGSQKKGIEIMAPKACYRVLKLYGISPVAANIIKQEMLSFGGEAAVAYGTINCSVKSTDLLLFGNLRHFQLLIRKLKMHQFNLPRVSEEIALALENYEKKVAGLKIGKKYFDFSRRTYLLGILNVTPDSFSDGGKFYRHEDAVRRGMEMVKEGADIIDVGGESTRPGARFVPEEEERRRVVPVVKELAKYGVIVSVDTRKAMVAKAALDVGAKMVNDVSALGYDKKMGKVVAEYQVPVCLMHMKGTPANMQKNPSYQDLMREILEYLKKSIEIAENAGILQEKIIVDPGIGFGKTVEHNLEILKRLKEFRILGQPILVGPSRKSVIGKVLNLPLEDRLEGTAALVAVAILNGAHMVRVHDVKEMSRVARMVDAVKKGLAG